MTASTKFLNVISVVLLALLTRDALAGQGAQRMLYTSPNMGFVEQTSGEVLITVNDTSGSISTLQTEINNARAANPTNVIVIRLTNASYVVSSAGIVLGSHECLVASGATIQAANSSVTTPLITITSGSTNVSVAGGVLNASGANIQGIYAPAAARVNVDKVIVQNCGQDCILLEGNGNSTYDNEMTVTRCDCSGSPAHAGISIQNSTQSAVIDNNCHNSSVGIYLSCAWANVANNTCGSNSIGIQIAGGDDNVVANNTCNYNGTGIQDSAANDMIVSQSLGNNSVAAINSAGSGGTFVDNLFTSGNATNFLSGGSGNHVIAYQGPLNAPSQDYFYPPLINDQHTDTIINGMGRTDLTISSTTISNVQNQYNAAITANPNTVIVLHLNGTFTVGSSPLTLSSDTCVLLNGTIQINSSTAASAAIAGNGSPTHISISGGVVDGGNLTGNNGITLSGSSMVQVDSVTLQNFGSDNPRVGSSDVIHFSGGSTPYVITRSFVNGGAARGIWLQLSGVKSIVSDTQVTAVNEDGVDCDSSTSGCVAKFNYLHDLVRYGVFFEQSASHNLALGDICNNDGRDINVYNNSATPRGATEYNNAICNCLMGNNGLRNGSTGTNTVVSSHNFFFNNTVINASISSETNGTQNYYSQNYLAGGTLSTAGTETFFNSPDVSSNLFIQNVSSSFAVQAQNASTNSGIPVVAAPSTGLGNDEWQLVPTDSGFYRIMNEKSALAMNVSGASLNSGALVIQYPFGTKTNDQWMPIPTGSGPYCFLNRLSGLCLDVPAGASGTQLDQQPYTNGPNQQFSLNLVAVQQQQFPFSLAASPISQTVAEGSTTNYTVTLATNSGFVGSITFALSGLPANATASFVPASLSGPGSSTLNITTATNTPADNYTMTIIGTNSSGASNSVAVTLAVTTPGSNLVWNSTSSAAWDTTTPNWLNQITGLNTTFQNGKNVIFADGANLVTNVTIASGVTVSPGSMSVNSVVHDYIISGAGNIAGTGALVKTGASTLTITTTNGFTGPTTISGGMVSVTSLALSGTASGIGAAGNNTTNLVLDGGALQWTGSANVTTDHGMTVTLNGGTLDSSPPESANLTLSGTIAFSGSGAHTLTLAGTDPNPLNIGGNTINSVIADGSGGPTTVQKIGNNAWNLTNANTYTGGTIINSGRVRANTSANVFGTGTVIVANGAQAYLNVGATYPNAFSLAGIGIPETDGNYGALRLAANGAFITNTITLTDDTRITARGATASAGAVIAGPITGDSALEFGNSAGTVGIITLSNPNNSWSGDTTISDGTVKMGAINVIPHGSGYGDVYINGSTNTLNSILDLNGTQAVVDGLNSEGYLSSDAVTDSSSSPATLIVGDNDANGVYGGIIVNGAGSVAFTKIGAGTEILTGANTYTGATVVSNGVLVVNGSLASASVAVMHGATLGGGGVIGGSVMVTPGATIAPTGVLTVNSGATLNGTTVIELNPALGTNDSISSLGSIVYGGVLSLTNVGGTFTNNSSFRLLNAVGYSGAFASITPAIPGLGLAWNTNTLASNGTLTIVSAPTLQPQISSIALSGPNTILSGSNGVPGWQYIVLTSTNLSLPLAEWVAVETNAFDASGNFILTNSAVSGPSQLFYMLQLQ